MTQDTEDDALRPLMALIPDPLDEILKRCWDELLNDMGDVWLFFVVFWM
jgi:hypothetical protein